MRLVVQSTWLESQRAAELATLRADGIRQINQMIGEVRARYITVMPGQEMIYLRKEVEARGFMSETEPDLANYAFIGREIGITAATGYEVAQVILNMSDMWLYVGSQLEALRMYYSNLVNASIDEDGLQEHIDNLSAALAPF